MLAIVDYKMGNIRSLRSALAFLGADAVVTDDPAQLLRADRIILPGVGAFDAAMRNLRERNLVEPLCEAVMGRRTLALGICLGVQILATSGDENGPTDGLGWIRGSVVSMAADAPGARIPHVGFNTVRFTDAGAELFAGLDGEKDFYFVHGYHLVCDDKADVAGWVDYAAHDFVASVHQDNVFGVQFHPEKSQSNGLTVLKNFVRL